MKPKKFKINAKFFLSDTLIKKSSPPFITGLWQTFFLREPNFQ
jgi:hypothetical protein